MFTRFSFKGLCFFKGYINHESWIPILFLLLFYLILEALHILLLSSSDVGALFPLFLPFDSPNYSFFSRILWPITHEHLDSDIWYGDGYILQVTIILKI